MAIVFPVPVLFSTSDTNQLITPCIKIHYFSVFHLSESTPPTLYIPGPAPSTLYTPGSTPSTLYTPGSNPLLPAAIHQAPPLHSLQISTRLHPSTPCSYTSGSTPSTPCTYTPGSTPSTPCRYPPGCTPLLPETIHMAPPLSLL